MIKTSDDKHKNIRLYMQFALCVFLLLNTASLINNADYSNFGWKSIDATFMLLTAIFCYYLLFNLRKALSYKKLLPLFVTFLATHYVSYSLYQDHNNFENIYKLTLYILAILSLILIKWNKNSLTFLSLGLSIIVLIVFRHWVYQDFPTWTFRSYFKHQNGLAMFLFLATFFITLASIYSKKFLRIYFATISLLGLILIYTTSSRAVFLAIFTFLISFCIYKISYKWFKLTFPFIALFNILFTFVYLFISRTHLKTPLNNLSTYLFNKPFFREEGRIKLWNTMIEEVFIESPLFGQGFGVRPADFLDMGKVLSTHNVYLQILVEVGIIGFFVFIVLLYYIWKSILKNIGSIAGQFSAFFLLATLMLVNFELTLFPNSPSYATIGLFQWLGFTIGINFIENDSKPPS
ncbi:O-antigen ligase family protein [Salinibacillus xinjiangensis]|uniref:O-antigen ligase-related domain-containing protein n=1 Tax=Salinibacillus xinjiangensis TaxID=1229268 RepID=A0A6G1X252_9BACI|nr:O-antigen ligase family protein [Salinibacillus xinjiangensis]MRG85077.1 hypothetical protein [Salinibacillus xinjiangensis]